MVIRLNSGPVALEVDPADGGRIISCTWQNLQLVAERREGVDAWGWFAMAPWAGRVRDGVLTTTQGDVALPKSGRDAIHGYAVRRPWDVEFSDQTRCVLTAPTPEPFRGGLMRQEIEIGRLAVHWSVVYIGGEVPLPAWVGLHPWFRRRLSRGQSAVVDFSAGRMLEQDERGLPTGRTIDPIPGPHDHAFTTMHGSPSVHWPGALRLVVESVSPWWVIFDRDPGAVCIEPQSSPPDAANLGLAPVLGDGEKVSVSATLRIIPD